MTTTLAPPVATRRIVALDVLRGFALCGILLANVKPIAHRGGPLATEAPVTGVPWLHLLVDQRFFPIFALLFGMGFQLLLDAAAQRVARPRVVLLRRLLALLAIGAAHHLLLWRGDILAVYATVGLVVLLPTSWLPRRVLAGLSAVLVTVSVVLLGGMYTLIPGMLLLGATLVRYGLPPRPGRWCLGFLAAAIPATVWQVVAEEPGLRIAYPLAGLLTAAAYVSGLLWLMRTPLRGVLAAVFVPLGRMALTNYLTATVLVLIVAAVVGGADGWSSGRVVAVAGMVLAAQWCWSAWWLRRFRQGPLEWLWRWVTWWHRPALMVGDRRG